MSMCGICKQTSSQKLLQNIYTKQIGNPPIIVNHLLLRITLGVEHELASKSICRKCLKNLTHYYDASIVMENIEEYILNLLQGGHSSDIAETELNEELGSRLDIDATTFFFLESPEVEEEESDERVHSELLYVETNPLEDEKDLKKVQDPEEDSEEKPPKKTYKDSETSDGKEKKIKSQTKKRKRIQKRVSKKSACDELNTENAKIQRIDCSQSTGVRVYHALGGRQPIGIHCKLCDRTFEHPKTFQAHKKYSGYAGFVCKTCGLTCFSQSGFLTHAKRHSSTKEFQCDQCDAAFYSKGGLKEHLARHKGDRPFKCEVCAKCFVHKKGLGNHKTIHNETLRNDCKHCNKKFRTVAHLRRHMAIHTGAKPFSCHICGNRFTQAYNVTSHIKHYHPSETNEKVESRPQVSSEIEG